MPDNPFQKDYETMSGALQEAKDQIAAIGTSEIKPLRDRIVANLSRQINALMLQNKAIDTTVRSTPQPLTKVLGNDLPPVKDRIPVQQQRMQLSQLKDLVKGSITDAEGAELKAKVTALYPQFGTIATDQLKDAYSDMEILGVAKMAELPVTEKTKVDVKLIEEIKKAIKKKQENELKSKQ